MATNPTGMTMYCAICNAPMTFDGYGGMECSNRLCPQSPYYASVQEVDPINHPPHYTQHPSGVECITITEAYNFNVGNAIKYLWRAGLKDGADAADDLAKAAWYVQREVERLANPLEREWCFCGNFDKHPFHSMADGTGRVCAGAR